MSFDLSTVDIREAAVLIQNPEGETPVYFWSQKAFKLTPVVEYFPVPVAVAAHTEERIKSLYYQIETDLAGEFESIATLFPGLSASLGASVLGVTDTPWRLITQSGRTWDFPRGGFITRPNLWPRVGGTLLGSVTFAACCASNKEPGAAGAFFTYSTGGTFPNFASLSMASILTLAPVVTYGSLMSSAHAEDGVQFEFKWDTTPVLDNGLIRDWTITSQEFTAKLKPYGLGFEAIATACGYDLAMGARLPTQTLIVSYSGFYAALRGATCKEAAFAFGPGEDVIQGLLFRATQTYASNVMVAPGHIATSPPA